MWTLLLSLALAAPTRTELTFGGAFVDPACLLRGDRDPGDCPQKQLTDADFRTFAETTAAPLLPGGFLVVPAELWTAPHRGAEPTPGRAWVMIVTWTDPAVSARLDEVRSGYMTLFQQTAVPRVDIPLTAAR